MLSRFSAGTFCFGGLCANIFVLFPRAFWACWGFPSHILADTFFIANYIGADGLASLNLALPIHGIINGTGLLIGIGGGVRYTLRHTRGDEKRRQRIYGKLTDGRCFVVHLCAVRRVRGGASGKIAWRFRHGLQPTTVYLKVCCLFSPFFILNNILTAFTRNDDAPGARWRRC